VSGSTAYYMGMENTLNLLLQDVRAKWYTTVNGGVIGPLSSKEIVLRIQSGALTFASHVWCEGFDSWMRIYDIEAFKCLLPQEPSIQLIQQIQESLRKQPVPPTPPAAVQKDEPRIWFVHVDGTQYGPFAQMEMITLVESNRVVANTYVWKQGFTEWRLAGSIPELTVVLSKQTTTADEGLQSKENSDKRKAPRKPFEARIILTDGKEVGWAVCRDISVGGMQVLMDKQPGAVGTKLKINVSPAADIPSFACEGLLVRVLEDGRGFSCRFVNLPADARAAIEKYIQVPA
jgi:hypothetical protein